MIWQTFHNILPSCVNIDHRGVDMYSTLCLMCEETVEYMDYALIPCPFASLV